MYTVYLVEDDPVIADIVRHACANGAWPSPSPPTLPT